VALALAAVAVAEVAGVAALAALHPQRTMEALPELLVAWHLAEMVVLDHLKAHLLLAEPE
jgi:hypothetical protein